MEHITAKCIRKSTIAGDFYPELELGNTYKVVKAYADCNLTLLIFEEFPLKEFNSVCFDIYDNEERLDYYWDDPRFQTPIPDR